MTLASLRVAAAALLALALAAGCAPRPPAAAAETAAPAAPQPAATTPDDAAPPVRVPPMSEPLPPERAPSPPRIDRSCRVDADCAVKDVGNCCGAYPACVNKDSPTDPAAVMAECRARGLSSTCGFALIESCRCDNGTCVGNPARPLTVDPHPAPAPETR